MPNSVTRHALPEGVFRGKSKQVWDYLWSVSRGAIVPNRNVRKSRREIKAGAGLGSMVTVDAALEHLQSMGLISVRPAVGSLVGNEYEVFTPDEASLSPSSTPSTPSITSTTSLTHNLDELGVPESGSTRITQIVANRDTSAPPNTFYKTRSDQDDDEAFAAFISTLKKAVRDITGKNPAPLEAERWREVGEVLTTELRIAAARTSVSNVPAFFAEHLRRRLFKKDKQQIEREASEGKAESGAQVMDGGKCPDCGGSGFWYPDGFEKGVAKCRHEKLVNMA